MVIERDELLNCTILLLPNGAGKQKNENGIVGWLWCVCSAAKMAAR